MLMLFTCEQCGKRILVDATMQGRKGRCGNCGHVMRIPRADEGHLQPPPLPQTDAARQPKPAEAHASSQPAAPPAGDAPFRLSPPEERPGVAAPPPRVVPPPVLAEPRQLHQHVHVDEEPSQFELLREDAHPDDQTLASPEVQRGLRELEEYRRDPRGYQLAEKLDSRFFRWARGSRPANFLYTGWRRAVGGVLRVLRFVDDWGYLISIPFLILIAFAITIGNRPLIHTGAVVVVLVNFGRFWTDLLALFVRPFKEGPIHGLMFFFPPYAIFFVSRHWDSFKGTFRRLLTSCAPILLVILAYAFIPVIDPAIQSAPTAREKLRRAEEEVVKEASEGLHQAREEVRKLEQKGRDALEKKTGSKARPAP
ncbi:MAG: zinc ribbon domain-containing protein [Isosphaeraceae bacterium]